MAYTLVKNIFLQAPVAELNRANGPCRGAAWPKLPPTVFFNRESVWHRSHTKAPSGYGSSRARALGGTTRGEGLASDPPAASVLGQWPTWQTKPEGNGLFTID